MIVNQLRAGRVLLDWTQDQLAHAAGLSRSAIAAFEQGRGHTRAGTLQAIRAALEGAGLEFTATGVQRHTNRVDMQVLEGTEAIPSIWADIQATFAEKKGEVLLSGVEESQWLKTYGERLKSALRRQRALGVFTRLLIAEGDNLVFIGPETYRAIPRAVFQQTPYYVYADRVAIITWGPPIKVLLVKNTLIAETFRRQFEFNWQHGKPLNPKDCVIIGLEGD